MRIEYKIVGFDPVKISREYGFGNKGKAELFLANDCFKRMSKYVPKDTGALMTTVTIRPGSVTYEQPYARRQYFENKGNGIRGKYWDKKMAANEGSTLAKELERYVKMLKGSS